MEKMKKILFQTLNIMFEITNKITLFILKYPILITALAILTLICFAALLVKKDLNVGGLLGAVWSYFHKSNNSSIAIANSIPSERKQAIGEKDSQGFVQHKVSELPNSLNPFRDKTIVVLPSGEKVKLPDGLKDTDIDLVIKTKAEILVIPYESNKIKIRQTEDLINKSKQDISSAEELLKKLKAKQ